MTSSPAATRPSLSRNGPGPRLKGRQIAVAFAWGLLIWIMAAGLVRATPPALFERGVWTVLLFLAAVPSAVVSVWVTRRLASLSAGQIAPGTAVACGAAMLCDGVALTWTPLYGLEARDLVLVAALLLWGVAAILFVAFVAARRAGA